MTLNEICEKHKDEVPSFLEGYDMSDNMFQDLYNYYFDRMPYGVRKARDGDPYEWYLKHLIKMFIVKWS